MENLEIVVSYSRKINHALYGGNSYESSDHFCSLKNVIDHEIDPKQAHEELAQLAEELVNARVDAEIAGFQGGIPQQDFETWMYDYVAGRPIDGEVYYKMSKYQQRLIQVIKRGKATAKRDKHENQKRGDQTITDGKDIQIG